MTAALAVASLVFTGGCVACLAYLHLAPTGYSPVRNAVGLVERGYYVAMLAWLVLVAARLA